MKILGFQNKNNENQENIRIQRDNYENLRIPCENH